METGTPATPDLEEVLQEPPGLVTVPVRVEGMTTVHDLPSRRAQYATDLIPALAWTPLLPETGKRKRCVLLSTDRAFAVSATGAGAGMVWPANVPLEIRNTLKVYVMSADPALPATLSHMSELWAD